MVIQRNLSWITSLVLMTSLFWEINYNCQNSSFLYIFKPLLRDHLCCKTHILLAEEVDFSRQFFIFSNLFWRDHLCCKTHIFLAEEVDFSRQVSLYMHNIKYVIIYFTWCPRHYYKIDKILRNLSFKSPWKISKESC